MRIARSLTMSFLSDIRTAGLIVIGSGLDFFCSFTRLQDIMRLPEPEEETESLVVRRRRGLEMRIERPIDERIEIELRFRIVLITVYFLLL
ncbi:hypothetical protein LINPERHAP2_LOCUS33605 [Linum perenne]